MVNENRSRSDPDPTLLTTEQLLRAISALRGEAKGWIDALQILQEREQKANFSLLSEKIEGGLRNVGTRLDGNDTALVAALKAQKEEAAKQTENFKEVLGEIKAGISKQFDSMILQINDLKDNISETGGRAKGQSHMVSVIIACLSALAAIAAIVITLTRPTMVVHESVRPALVRLVPWPEVARLRRERKLEDTHLSSPLGWEPFPITKEMWQEFKKLSVIEV